MIISGRGWIWAASLLVLGGKAGAEDDTAAGPDTNKGPFSTNTLSSSSSSTFGSTSIKSPTNTPTPASIPPAVVVSPERTKITEQPIAEATQAMPDILAQSLNGPTLKTLWKLPASIFFNQEATFDYRLAILKPVPGQFLLVLAQTDAKDGASLSRDNTRSIVQLIPCQKGNCEAKPFDSVVPGQFATSQNSKSEWIFQQNTDLDSIVKVNPNNFFLCFGFSESPQGLTCHAYSDFFSIGNLKDDSTTTLEGEGGVPNDSGVPSPPQLPKTALYITPGIPIITYQGMPPSVIHSASAGPTTVSIATTMTSGAIFSTAISSGSPNVPKPVGRGNGLSTGAIVGIALGSFVVVSLLAILTLFFCIRRRRRAQSGTTHEQAMLTRSHPESSSQDGLAEKDNTARTLIHPNSNDSSFLFPDQNDTAVRQTLIPIGTAYGGPVDQNTSEFRDVETRSLHTSPYEPAPVVSSAAPVFAAASSPPRRKPTNASTASAGAVSALSRNTSSATTASTESYGDYPVHSQLQNIGEESNSPTGGESQAHYGETPRHFPQISERGSNSPFLSEPGMSVEEIARLDEEERRIDAAIAAADEQRERDSSGSGLR